MFTDLSHRALLFALCSFIMCACFATCYLAQNRTETFLDFPHPNALLFPKCLTSHRFAAASSATFGREQHEQRPRAARTAAASRQRLLIARRAPTEWWQKSVKDAASARCQRETGRQAGMPHPSRGQTLLSPPFSPFSTTLPQPRVFKIQKNICAFFAKQQVAKHAHMINEQSAKRSALKGQPVHSPGQRPGSQRINAYAL